MKRILLNWFEMPARPELLTVFRDIADKVEFIHLYHRTPAERKDPHSPFPMIYWFDYKSPWQMLDEVKPDKIITMNANDLLSISLIVAARARGITTFVMQHGFIPDGLDDVFIPLEREPVTQKGTLKRYKKLLSFFLKSNRPFSLKRFGQYCKFAVTYFRQGPIESTKKLRYPWRMPDYYLCFSRYSGKYYQLRDRFADDRLLELGVPMFDEFFKQLALRPVDSEINPGGKAYYLLIDTSFGEYKEEISKDKIYRCYNELAAYCADRNSVLKIKLHPWSYGDAALKDSEHIQFYRKIPSEELNALIFNAKACFGFYSTLTMPVVCVKKLCQVAYDNIYVKELVEEGITPVVDFFTFGKQDILLDDFTVNEENRAKFMRKYLYKTDGKAAERLLQILTAE